MIRFITLKSIQQQTCKNKNVTLQEWFSYLNKYILHWTSNKHKIEKFKYIINLS